MGDELIATIWIEINIAKNKSISVMGGYRQWRYLKQLNINDSNKTQEQILRLETILNQYKKAINENKEIITMIDTNINTSHQSDHNKIYKVSKLYDIFNKFISKHNLTIHNTKNTYFPLHKSTSCIDYIISNIP